MITNFLITGARGAGKSTLVRRIEQAIHLPCAGFRTLPQEHYDCGNTYNLTDLTTGETAPISTWDGQAFRPVEATFLDLGVRCLNEARTGSSPLLILDELGRFERRCTPFLRSVETVLDSDKTVLAVLKKEPIDFIDRIRARADCCVFDLDLLCRDAIFPELAALVSFSVEKSAK